MNIREARSINEIAVCYFPHITKRSATNQFRTWIYRSSNLKEDLEATGWKKGMKLLTPRQINLIIDHFGEP